MKEFFLVDLIQTTSPWPVDAQFCRFTIQAVFKRGKKTEVKENNSYSSVLKHHRKFKLTYILHLKHLTYK